jgi:hypothetical protein
VLSDFLPLMTEEQMRDLASKAKRIFVPEVTGKWEENVRARLR